MFRSGFWEMFIYSIGNVLKQAKTEKVGSELKLGFLSETPNYEKQQGELNEHVHFSPWES